MKPIRIIHFDKAADVPNSNLPVLIYRSALQDHAADKARAFRNGSKSTAGVGFGRTRFTTTPTSIPMLTKYWASRKAKSRYVSVEIAVHSYD